MAQRIAETFGQFDVKLFEENQRAKTYRCAPDRSKVSDRLPTAEWEMLIQALSSPEYQRGVSDLTGVPLDQARLAVDAWEYRIGDWLAPQVDKAEKLVTQIFYLTGCGVAQDSGRLLILGTPDAAKPT